MKSAPRADVLVIGSELTRGAQVDLNGPSLRYLAESAGYTVVRLAYLADDVGEIARAVASSLDADVPLLLLSGGLGPTTDDVTRQGLAEALGVSVEVRQEELDRLARRARDRGGEVDDGSRRQALFPEGSEVLPNAAGSAAGIYAEVGSSMIFALPGVPRELEAMISREVRPRLLRRCPQAIQRGVLLRTAGIGEAELARRLDGLLAGEDVEVGYLAAPGEVEVSLLERLDDENAPSRAEALLEKIEEAIGSHLYQVVRTRGQADAGVEVLRLPKAAALPQVVGAALEQRDWRLATAESCTGGLLARRITDLPGSSAFYVGGVVAYANTLKSAQLGVSAAVLASSGAVSASCAAAMARGAHERLGAEVAVSTTGIAGPAGGSADKPVGLVYIAVVSPEARRVCRHLFSGDRWIIREKAVVAALDEVRRLLAGLPASGSVDEGDGAAR